MTKRLILLSIPFILLFPACQSSDSGEGTTRDVTAQNVSSGTTNIPEFNADSAYQFIATQVAFGPRVPATKGHLDCANWLEMQLWKNCDTVYRQETKVTAGNGTQLPCINLIGSLNPEAKKRILLLAHWDTRPWADREEPPSNKAIDGADDGASGVGVLLELSRIIRHNPLPANIGIDILFVDVEDYGKSEWGGESYALGARYWAGNPHLPGYTAEAGILLDMVGAYNARFPHEGYSKQYAGTLLRQVWGAAGRAGFSSYFVYENGGYITDDHVPVNEIRNIPTIDIINLPSGSPTGFGSHWHTHADNMDVIDKKTLKAVGQTLLQYLYELRSF